VAPEFRHSRRHCSVLVDNQHGIQPRINNFNKTFVFEGAHSKEVDRRISEEGNFLKWNLFAFASIFAEYMQKI